MEIKKDESNLQGPSVDTNMSGATQLQEEPRLAVASREALWNQCVIRIARADQAALAQLYDEAGSLVFGLALRILRDRTDAEEVTLDVFMQVWSRASGYDKTRGSVTAWLMILTRSRAIDRLRTNERQRSSKSTPVEDAPELHAEGASPEQSSILHQQRDLVRKALDSLPREQRQAIKLAYFNGLSQSELASHLGLPLGTLKTRVRLGMIRLRELLGSLAS